MLYEEKTFGLNWCSIVDVLQTSAIEAVNDQKLKMLANVFNLSDSLI
jgi:hypothetical protein